MMVIVKFKGSPTPTIMQVENVAYIHDLSTMARVEWVSGGYFSSKGSYHTRKDLTRNSALGDVIADPYRPGDPSPYERTHSTPDILGGTSSTQV